MWRERLRDGVPAAARQGWLGPRTFEGLRKQALDGHVFFRRLELLCGVLLPRLVIFFGNLEQLQRLFHGIIAHLSRACRDRPQRRWGWLLGLAAGTATWVASAADQLMVLVVRVVRWCVWSRAAAPLYTRPFIA